MAPRMPATDSFLSIQEASDVTDGNEKTTAYSKYIEIRVSKSQIVVVSSTTALNDNVQT